jgi:hypothetical protein
MSEQHLDRIHWGVLSENPNAIPLLEKHFTRIHWRWISMNPKAIHILEKNLDKIDWELLAANNPQASSILEKHPERYELRWTLHNPCALHLFCDIDYAQMKEKRMELKEELQAYLMHPDRLIRRASQAGMDLRTYIQCIH